MASAYSLQILSAEGLPLELLSSRSSKLFVKVSCEGQKWKTKAVAGSGAPSWNESLHVTVDDVASPLIIKVMQKASSFSMQSTFLCEFAIELDELLDNEKPIHLDSRYPSNALGARLTVQASPSLFVGAYQSSMSEKGRPAILSDATFLSCAI